jgi:DNA-binding response OmpR family regulator
VLSRAGYRVIVACDGDEAVSLFDDHRADIDLARLDVVMPKRTGRAVYEAIRARDASLPVLFSSGYTQGALDAEGRERIDVPVISKPYSPQELLRAVHDALAHARV